TLRNGDKVSVSAAHELAEMLVDPAINLASTGPKNMLYAYETADPVESEEFPLDGVPMTDFVYPSYFEAFRKPGSTKFDHLGKLRRPFQILPGGYQIVYRNGRWSQIYGSKAKARRFAAEDRRGHRSTYRGHPPVRRSAARWGDVLALGNRLHGGAGERHQPGRRSLAPVALRRLGAALGRAGEAGVDRRQDALRVAVDRAGGEPAHLSQLLDAGHRTRRERGEHDVVGDEVGTDVGARRAPLAPRGQLAQHRQLARAEALPALHRPVALVVGQAGEAVRVLEGAQLLVDPRRAPALLQVG